MFSLHHAAALAFATALCCSTVSFASETRALEQPKTAIVLAHFGTTVPSGLKSIDAISEATRKAYPNVEVRVTFTSNIVRSIWRQRLTEEAKWLGQGVPQEILHVKNIIQTLGDLSEEGYRDIIVQPSHIFYMEESRDLEEYVKALGSIDTMKEKWRPFNRIALGRPALGALGNRYDYHEDVDSAASALAADVAAAKKMGGVLLYMGHGNEHWPSGIYVEAQKAMREKYPNTKTYIGTVEGTPNLPDVIAEMKRDGVKKIYLKPFMVTAGDHATNDMAGDDKDSWLSILKTQGFTVQPVLKGLGENPDFVRLFVEHIKDAAKDAGIAL
ncbi:MAG: sirohydrochlorin cobaltochelatase [Desulfobulbaceae bacterium]|jgi:sirohydrochlorin cobaltochelatase|nr:sirohydrochlorin cobaltochelatase [Desulfobulbaceae bacterium]